MSFLSVGVATALVWFLAIDGIGAIVVIGIARRLARGPDGLIGVPPATLLSLRFAPVAAATLFVIVLVAPAYWQLEPRGAGEQIGLTLVALAAGTVAMIAASLWRTVSALTATARAARLWTARSDRRSGGDCPVPLFDDRCDRAFVALLGIVRPRLFIGRRVRELLDGDELSLVVAHELAHCRRRDNLARLAIAGCRDALALVPAGRRIEDAWKAAVEQAADLRAAAGDRTRALHLASALVKVARLMPPPAPPAAIISGVHEAGQEALLHVRVRRLLARDLPRARSPLPALAISFAAILLAIILAPAVRPFVHEATELLVRALP